jgi:hypothetical protein
MEEFIYLPGLAFSLKGKAKVSMFFYILFFSIGFFG